MFSGATNFNGDVSGWDVSSVTDMTCMFEEATSFDRDLSKWNIGRDTKRYDMFLNATGLKNSGLYTGESGRHGYRSNWTYLGFILERVSPHLKPRDLTLREVYLGGKTAFHMLK